jgi:2,4-dienoyl-CoA reductase-like NADH-dependent reductase (Old Yellow Enzyme family)
MTERLETNALPAGRPEGSSSRGYLDISRARPLAYEILLTPTRLGRLELPNRMVVAPMTRISATGEGRATAAMAAYYRDFAAGGFGLVITEGIYTDCEYSQGYLGQPGLADRGQAAAWRAAVGSVHACGGRIVAQLMHAGALSQGNRYRRQTTAPSAIQPRGLQLVTYHGNGPFAVPLAMSDGDIKNVMVGFAAAARLAQDAGFDGVEIHGANGYLLDQFLTDYTNQRLDGYGGDVLARVRLTVDVIRAVRNAVGPDFLVGVRISQAKVNDFEYKWTGGERDAGRVFPALARASADYVHTTEFEAWRPAFGSDGPSLAALAKAYGRLPVISNGSLHDPRRAAALLESGGADLVSLGRGALANPDWVIRVRTGRPLSSFDRRMLMPLATLDNAAAWSANTHARDAFPK